MKILIINSLYPPYHRGGAEVVVQTIVDALKKEHDIHVLTIQPWKGFSSSMLSAEQQGNVTVHRFFPFNIFSFINIDQYPLWLRMIWHIFDACNLHSYYMTRSLLRELQPDLVLTHNVKGIGYTVFRALSSSRIKTIHTMHDVQMIDPSGLIMWGNDEILTQPSYFQRCTMMVIRWLVGSPDRIIFPSRFLKTVYENYGFFNNSAREVLQNPIADNFLTTDNREKTLRQPCRLLILGQVGEHKGIRVAIEALQQVPQLSCDLAIVGDGALVEYVKEQSKKDARIHYLGRLDREQIKEQLSDTDYTVVPSLCYENSPMVIYESMAAGVPVIAADIGGVAELVQDGVNGYIVTPGSSEELAQVLVKAASNHEYTQYTHSARKTVAMARVSNYIKKIFSY